MHTIPHTSIQARAPGNLRPGVAFVSSLLLSLILLARGATAAPVPAPPTWPPDEAKKMIKDEEAAAAAEAEKVKVSEKPSAEKTARGREAVSAFMMWCGILVLGLGLIAAVMIWGRRLRRASRQQPAAPTLVDPFWYLKKRPPKTAAANKADGSSQESSGSAGAGDPQTP